MRRLYIFDLDGTLALIGHRRYLVEGENKDWRAFFAACVDDEPNHAVLHVMRDIFESGAEIWIWSGRSDEVRQETEAWLDLHDSVHNILRMRETGDHQPDEKLKKAWLDGLDSEDRARLVGIFEDRDRMVSLWRENGICCFQVAPGDF